MSCHGTSLVGRFMEAANRFFCGAGGLLRFAVCVCISRLLVLTGLMVATGGREISNDVAAHMDMVRHPLIVLFGGDYGQYPPLLPLFETVFAFPAQLFFSDMVALRLCMIAYEVILSVLFYLCMVRLNFSEERRAQSCLAFLIFPTGWIVSAVMSQDEVIAATLLMGAILLLSEGRRCASLALCSFGIGAGKIFLAIPLMVLCLATDAYANWQRAMAAFAPVAGIYATTALSS